MTNTAYTLINKVTGEVLTTPDNDGRIASFCIPPMPPYSELYKEDLNEVFNNIELASGLWSCELNKRLKGEEKKTYISQLEVVEVEWCIE